MTTILICVAVYLVGVLIVGRTVESGGDAAMVAIMWPFIFVLCAGGLIFGLILDVLDSLQPYSCRARDFVVRLITGRKP